MKLTAKNSRRIVALIITLCTVIPLWAGDASDGSRFSNARVDVDGLDRFVQKHMRAYRISGLAYSVVRNGEVLHMNAFGNAGSGRSMSTQTPTQAASLAKSFTAVAIMQLVEEGKLRLDAPVRNYLPWFRPDAHNEWPSIQVRHLLYQTSGLTEMGLDAEPPADATLEEAVRTLNRVHRNYPPGERFHYFNLNYTVLGLLIETISGMTYSEYIKQEIFNPLDMTDSSMVSEAGSGISAALGHGVLFGFPYSQTTERSAYCGPSGGLITTAEDVSAYMAVHLNGGRSPKTGGRIISEESLSSLHVPGIGTSEAGYAMGWITGRYNDSALLRHGGSLPGYRSFLWLLPEEEIGIAVFMNQNGFLPAMLAYSSIPEGLAALTTGGAPRRAFPLRLLYWGITATAILLILKHVHWWLRRYPRLRRARAAGTRQSRLGAHIGGALMELLIAVSLIVAVPPVTESLLERNMTWKLGFQMAPGVMIIIWIVIITACMRGLGKLHILYTMKFFRD